MLYFPTCLELRNVSGSFKITQGHSSNSTQLFDGCSTSYCCSVVTVRLTSYIWQYWQTCDLIWFSTQYFMQKTWLMRLLRGENGLAICEAISVCDGRTDGHAECPSTPCLYSVAQQIWRINWRHGRDNYVFFLYLSPSSRPIWCKAYNKCPIGLGLMFCLNVISDQRRFDSLMYYVYEDDSYPIDDDAVCSQRSH